MRVERLKPKDLSRDEELFCVREVKTVDVVDWKVSVRVMGWPKGDDAIWEGDVDDDEVGRLELGVVVLEKDIMAGDVGV